MEQDYLLTLLIRIAEGPPGKFGIHVLKTATSKKEPLPKEFIPHTRNLKAMPSGNSIFRTDAAAKPDSI